MFILTSIQNIQKTDINIELKNGMKRMGPKLDIGKVEIH